MKTLSFLALSLAVLVPGAAAQSATLVEDIAAQEAPQFARIHSLHALGQGLLFQSFADGEDAWATDGTVSGTRMLPDGCPDSCYGADLEVMGALGNRIVYLLGEVWSTDGTIPGTVPLTDPGLQIGEYGSPAGFRLGNRIYFKACRQDEPGETRCAVWSTDGTRAGTGPVPVLTPDPELVFVSGLAAGDDRVYFIARDDFGGRSEIWAADASGARRLLETPDPYRETWTAWKNLLFFTAIVDGVPELWATDGTSAGTRSLGSFAGSLRAWLSTGPGGLYFVAEDVTHGEEIWRSDGTPQGTRRVTEFGSYAPFYLFFFDEGQEGWAFEIDGRLLFAADDQLTGRRLWISSGTPESTKPASEPGLASRLYRAGNRLFAFRYDQDLNDCEVWSFDGKGTGTRLVDRLAPENCGPSSYWSNIRLEPAGGRAWFAAQDGPSSWSVWRSDGTASGTVKLFTSASYIGEIEVAPGESRVYIATGQGLWLWEAQKGARQIVGTGLRNASSFPFDLTAHQGGLAFTASDGVNYYERTIWTSRGSEADTSMLVSDAGAGCNTPGRLASTGPTLVYVCANSFESELRSAAAGGGSVPLAHGVPRDLLLLEHEGRVWFVQEEGEVWTTDGTPAGTARLTDAGGSPLLAQHDSGISPTPPWALSDGQFVYFLASRPGEQEARLWRSDGTPAGTIPLPAGSFRSGFELARAGSTTLVHLGDDLWRTDGTPAGTQRLTRSDGQPLLEFPHLLTAHGGAFYIYGQLGFNRTTLWRTDGTANGTFSLLPSFRWPSSGAYDQNFPLPEPASAGGKLVFAAADPEHGAELWATDGTVAGTALLADIVPGPSSSAPSGFFAAGGVAWFTAFDPVHGRELWRTDGTAAGTRLVQDIAPESRSSLPEQLAEAGGRLYFSADDRVNGRELWSLPLAGPGACQPSDTALCLQGGRFRVESRWRDFQGNGGVGKAVPLTGDTGTFWFFSPSNVEVLLKVLDGRGLNDHFWVFYGALSSVEYSLTVTDTQTGLTRRYSNPAGQLASAGDTQGFGPLGARSTVPDVFTAAPSPPARVRGWSSAAATAPCAPGARRLCLNGGRFAVEVSWKDFQGKTGQGTAVPATADTGYFWFFDKANIELAVKVLDGRALNGKFWVFFGALSNVEYTITVTDTQTGSVKQYKNPAGQFGSVADTGAF